MITDMTNKQTAAHLREWADRFERGEETGLFGWPTDACGYDQHVRFVEHRNRHWTGGREGFAAFVRGYADSLLNVAEVVAWQLIDDADSLKACPQCGTTAMEGETQCTNCGCEPNDDETWRKRKYPYTSAPDNRPTPDERDD